MLVKLDKKKTHTHNHLRPRPENSVIFQANGFQEITATSQKWKWRITELNDVIFSAISPLRVFAALFILFTISPLCVFAVLFVSAISPLCIFAAFFFYGISFKSFCCIIFSGYISVMCFCSVIFVRLDLIYVFLMCGLWRSIQKFCTIKNVLLTLERPLPR